MTLFLALLLGCPAREEPAPAPAPVVDEGPAPIPLGLLDPEVAPTPRPPPGTVIPRDPWAPPTVLRNHPERCDEFGAIAPSPREDGHWAAVRLVPPKTPFAVERVEVLLAHGSFNNSTCDASQHYRMRLYAVSADAGPPDGNGTDPETPWEYDFFERRDQQGDRALTATVSPPLVLEAGQTLIVAVSTRNSGKGPRTCVKTCLEGEKNGRTFWSNTADESRWAWTVYEPSRGTGMWATAEGR